MKNKLILLGLNELNFEFINYYIEKGFLPNFNKLFEIQKPIKTISEDEYHLLEPWIQWVTIHTGKSFSEHQIFRLGDIVNDTKNIQIFEELESNGFSIGAVSPFNADNRLNNPLFFIPDPWTKTKISANFLIKSIYNAISQTVNDNAKNKISFKSYLSILLGLIFYVPVFRWPYYFKQIFNLNKPGTKAIILDSILSDIFIKLTKKYKPDFSNLFLNSGAHIQHHYLFNSKAYKGNLKNPNWYCNENYDPLIKILKEYDNVLGRLMKIDDYKIIVATGLHQQVHEKLTFYWRINKHKEFIKKLGITNFLEILPRMSRDFLINFKTVDEAKIAENILKSFYSRSDNLKIFNVDNRGKSIFIELIYPKDLTTDSAIISEEHNLVIENFKSYVSFVAIKNGAHNGMGYLASNFKTKLPSKIKLKEVNGFIKSTLKS